MIWQSATEISLYTTLWKREILIHCFYFALGICSPPLFLNDPDDLFPSFQKIGQVMFILFVANGPHSYGCRLVKAPDMKNLISFNGIDFRFLHDQHGDGFTNSIENFQ